MKNRVIDGREIRTAVAIDRALLGHLAWEAREQGRSVAEYAVLTCTSEDPAQPYWRLDTDQLRRLELRRDPSLPGASDAAWPSGTHALLDAGADVVAVELVSSPRQH